MDIIYEFQLASFVHHKIIDKGNDNQHLLRQKKNRTNFCSFLNATSIEDKPQFYLWINFRQILHFNSKCFLYCAHMGSSGTFFMPETHFTYMHTFSNIYSGRWKRNHERICYIQYTCIDTVYSLSLIYLFIFSLY